MSNNAVARQNAAPAGVAKRTIKVDQLREGLARYTDSIGKVLPKELTPDRLMTLALVAATKTPKLYECSPESIALAIIRVAQWGLEIGTTAHLVPFNNKIKGPDGQDMWVTTCTAIADYKGLIAMVEHARVARDVKARVVYSNETFLVRGGSREDLTHEVIADDSARGHPVAVYAIAKTRGGEPTWEIMTKSEVEKIRNGAISKDSPAWKNHWLEMAKKTVIRRLCKRLPQVGLFGQAMRAEDELEQATIRVMQEAPSIARGPIEVARIEAPSTNTPEDGGAADEPTPKPEPAAPTSDANSDAAIAADDQELLDREAGKAKGAPAGSLSAKMPKGGAVQDALGLNDNPVKPNRNAQEI